MISIFHFLVISTTLQDVALVDGPKSVKLLVVQCGLNYFSGFNTRLIFKRSLNTEFPLC